MQDIEATLQRLNDRPAKLDRQGYEQRLEQHLKSMSNDI